MSIKEESHTLREWQGILANNPELMAEFEEMTPPPPIKGDIYEQPVLPGIDEEGIPGRDFIPVDWVDACERYGKWKIVSAEQPVEGLEEEISRTYHDGSVADTDDMDHNDYENIARHFAEWQKDKMMEGAVEVGTVVEEGRYCPEIGPIFLEESAGLKPGDKVRIIIAKEDEK